MNRYEFCEIWPGDGMTDHPVGRAAWCAPPFDHRGYLPDEDDGKWMMDGMHHFWGPTDEGAMRPIVEDAMRKEGI